jgi:hypothetical protein
MDLTRLPIGKVYKSIMDASGSFVALGFIPPWPAALLASLAGAQAADESFCERVLSPANLVLTEGKTCLSSTTIEMLVILRINRTFMEFMRKNNPQLSRQQFNATVVVCLSRLLIDCSGGAGRSRGRQGRSALGSHFAQSNAPAAAHAGGRLGAAQQADRALRLVRLATEASPDASHR